MKEQKSIKVKKSVAYIGGSVSLIILIVLSIILFSSNKKVKRLENENACINTELSYNDSIQIKSLYIIKDRLNDVASFITSIEKINETIYDIDNIILAAKNRKAYGSFIRLHGYKKDYKQLIEFSMDEIKNICAGITSHEDIEKRYIELIESNIEREREESKTKL